MGGCAVHAHSAGKTYRAIVMPCPPHLVETWRAELERVFPDGAVDVHVLEKWTELLSIPREKPARPTWLDGILSLTFKLELPEEKKPEVKKIPIQTS